MSTQHTPFREMNDAQRLAWGAVESQARAADLSGVKSAKALKTAQDAAKMRRKAIGASRGQAAYMVVLANQDARVQ